MSILLRLSLGTIAYVAMYSWHPKVTQIVWVIFYQTVKSFWMPQVYPVESRDAALFSTVDSSKEPPKPSLFSMTLAVRFPCASRCAEFSSHTHDSAFDESEKEGHDIRLTYIDRRIKRI